METFFPSGPVDALSSSVLRQRMSKAWGLVLVGEPSPPAPTLSFAFSPPSSAGLPAHVRLSKLASAVHTLCRPQMRDPPPPVAWSMVGLVQMAVGWMLLVPSSWVPSRDLCTALPCGRWQPSLLVPQMMRRRRFG